MYNSSRISNQEVGGISTPPFPLLPDRRRMLIFSYSFYTPGFPGGNSACKKSAWSL